jgi:hypothetical protein
MKKKNSMGACIQRTPGCNEISLRYWKNKINLYTRIIVSGHVYTKKRYLKIARSATRVRIFFGTRELVNVSVSGREV